MLKYLLRLFAVSVLVPTVIQSCTNTNNIDTYVPDEKTIAALSEKMDREAAALDKANQLVKQKKRERELEMKRVEAELYLQKKKLNAQIRKEAISISAVKLFGTYNKNGVQADSIYGKKVIKVTGIISKIDKNIYGETYVTLDTNTSIFSVQCFFDSKHTDSLSMLEKGSNITIIGKCMGKKLNIILVGCEL